MFIDQQIRILEGFLKDHVKDDKTGVMMLKFQLWHFRTLQKCYI